MQEGAKVKTTRFIHQRMDFLESYHYYSIRKIGNLSKRNADLKKGAVIYPTHLMAITTIFSAINPRCAIHTPFRLFAVNLCTTYHGGSIYLYADPFPAVLALHRMLDDRIIGKPFIETSNSIQGDSNTHEVQTLINENSV